MDFNGNIRLLGGSTLRNARIERLAADPVSPLDGQLWYNTTDNVYRGFDGTVVMTFASGGNTALIQTELDSTQTAAGFNADGTLTAFSGSNYLVSSESLRAALVALDTQLKSASDAAAQAQTEVDAVETALAAEVIRATDAEGVLTTDLAAEVTRATTAEGTLTTNLAAEVTRATNAEAAIAQDLADEITARGLAELAIQNEIEAKLNGLKWKTSVRAIEINANLSLTGAATVDGVVLANGDRVAVIAQTEPADNGIYVVNTAGAWTRSTDFDGTSPINEINSAAFFVEEGTSLADTGWTQINQVNTVGTDAVAFTQFNGAAGIGAGAGLYKTGNTLEIGEGAGIVVTADAIEVALASAGGLGFDGSDAVQVVADGSSITVSAAGIKVSDTLTTEFGALRTDLTAETSARSAADTALQTELDATQVGAGLAADGTLAAFTGANYVSAADSLRAAVVALDTQAKANADAVAAANTRLTDSMYLYTSGASATTHVVTHNLGQQFTQVTVIDSTNQVIIPDSVTFDSANQMTVVFSSAINCKVVVSAPKTA